MTGAEDAAHNTKGFLRGFHLYHDAKRCFEFTSTNTKLDFPLAPLLSATIPSGTGCHDSRGFQGQRLLWELGCFLQTAASFRLAARLTCLCMPTLPSVTLRCCCFVHCRNVSLSHAQAPCFLVQLQHTQTQRPLSSLEHKSA